MRAIVVAAIAAVLVPVSASAQAMTDTECQAAWMAADKNSDGFVTEAEAARYHASMRAAGKSVTDGRIGRDVFLTDCKSGLFAMRANDPGAPLKGANSFTEQQAKDRAIAFGMSDVNGLAKDSEGIWRAKAMHDGKSVNVAIDFKGNVVAN